MTQSREPGRATGGGSLRRALAFSSIGTGAARVTGALGGVLAARILGPSGRGELAVLVFVATALSAAAAAGIQFSVARSVARHGGVACVLGIVRTHVALVTMVVGGGGLVIALVVAASTGLGVGVAVLVPVAVIAAATNLVLLSLPGGVRAMGVIAVATVAGGVAYLALQAVLLAVGADSVALVLSGMVLSAVVSSAVCLRWIRGAPRGAKLDDDAERPSYREALAFGLPGGLAELVFLGMLRVDVVIVAALLPLREVGLYAAATALAELLWVIPDGIAQVVLPTSAARSGVSRTPALLKASLALMGAAGLALLFLARPVIDATFGAGFEGAREALPFLVVASLAGGTWKILGAEVVARGRTTPRLVSAAAGLLTMVVVDLVAVPSLGISGGALGSACGYGVAALIVAHPAALRPKVSVSVSVSVREQAA